MKPLRTFNVAPSLPGPLERLRDLAYNLRWAWHRNTIELFRHLDRDLWESTNHNPVLMLGLIDQAQLNAAATDEGFLAQLEVAARDLDTYLAGEFTWYHRLYGTASKNALIAYFSAEFGITECLSIFAGGLGVLAGDHLKSASDLGLPFIGVGLLYQQGYFRQYLNEAGWQQEDYAENDFHNLPLTLQRNENGESLIIEVAYPDRQVAAQVWRANVGRVALYLLDTNLPVNRPEDRDITYQLYGGDEDMRIKQEIMLGIGGYQALEALELKPTVYHMNEGHSGFLALERVRRLMQAHNLSFAEAREAASAGLVFTTHTPVEAGHDYFPQHLVEHYFRKYMAVLGLSVQEFMAMGRQNPANQDEPFCMTILALRLATYSNGVSQLHGEVTRQMWHGIWPDVPVNEIPIGHVTNGVHFVSWTAREMQHLYDRYLGPRWREQQADPKVWQRSEHIAPEELWRTHERRRQRLVTFARRRMRTQLHNMGASRTQIEAADEILDPEALTIGFARRFAPYKRSTLLLRDPERLSRILNNPDRPVQVIFAGKAHPRNDPGKHLLQRIVQLSQQEDLRRKLIFLEDYDMGVSRYLVQGADIWLNTPRRPREASGTSGMKATANGVLNLSILDGWWDEAYLPDVGWAIGRGEIYDDEHYQDQVEAENLYGLLELDIIPEFYDRGADGLPRSWIARMKANICKLCPSFNTHRMVEEYAEKFYLPANNRYNQLTNHDLTRAKSLAAWKERVVSGWPLVRVEEVKTELKSELQVGDEIRATARLNLGDLKAEDVTVELYMGRVDAGGSFASGEGTAMRPVKIEKGGIHCYEVNGFSARKSGLHGFTIRVLPHHPDLRTPLLPGLIVWA